jgi:leader peptidase (prepilin peptidase) / N-methyltransferase
MGALTVSLANTWPGLLIAVVFGLAVGSFANVVIYRSPRDGLSSFRPARSFCPACRRQIAWHDNLPVLSWLLLRARCRGCAGRISARYPGVELLVGALFAGAWWHIRPADTDGLVRLLVAWYLVATCVVVTLIDLEHLIIPDTITWPGMFLGLLLSAAFPVLQVGHPGFRPDAPHMGAFMASLFGLLAGGGSLMLVGMAGNIMLRRKLQEAGVQDAMGWGDVKWMALAGAFLGASSVLGAILIGCFAGALAGILMKLVARMRGQPQPLGLPFGPFLSVGLLIELARPGIAWSVLEQITRPA